jgi:hypothetical protein
MLFTGSALPMETEATNNTLSVTCEPEGRFKVYTDGGTEFFQIKIVINEQEYNSTIETNFSWLVKEKISPIDVQDFEINHYESLYLDTHWSAIATPCSPYPILVTSYIYDCVTLALISPQKIGMYHVYPEDKDEKVIKFVKFFMEKDTDLINAILVTGVISPNLSRCYHILEENSLNMIHVYTLPVIQPTTSDNEKIFHPTILDKNKLMTTPSILGEFFTKVALDARSGKICLNFDIEKLERESENSMEKAIKARNADMEIRFCNEDWGPYK